MAEYYVYILASRPGGAIYVGVTRDLVRRVYEHKNGAVPGHTTRYGIDKLVYFEQYPAVYEALQREKNMKHWPRVYKRGGIFIQRLVVPKRDGRDKPGHDE